MSLFRTTNLLFKFYHSSFLGITTPFATCHNIADSFPLTSICEPKYEPKINESLEKKKARLLYQSRKRGMLENGLILSTFADKNLDSFTEELLNQYDNLINQAPNDWDIYYWATGKEEIPFEFENEIMTMLKDHIQNREREERFRQPDLREK